jgi:hypothetical protein
LCSTSYSSCPGVLTVLRKISWIVSIRGLKPTQHTRVILPHSLACPDYLSKHTQPTLSYSRSRVSSRGGVTPREAVFRIISPPKGACICSSIHLPLLMLLHFVPRDPSTIPPHWSGVVGISIPASRDFWPVLPNSQLSVHCTKESPVYLRFSSSHCFDNFQHSSRLSFHCFLCFF